MTDTSSSQDHSSQDSIAQTIIVTGAASGIGKASVDYLLSKHHRVVAVDLNLEALKTAFPITTPNLYIYAADISDPKRCVEIAAHTKHKCGKIDALMHWAAVHSTKTWEEVTAEEFDRVLRVNVTGSFLIAQAVAKSIKETGGGTIILTGSTSVIHGSTGDVTGTGGPVYVTSKASITGMVRSLAKALGSFNIRVNGVMPGPTRTTMTQNYDDLTLKHIESMSPLGRIATPEDIAEAGCFLISHEARFISGELLIVNGATTFG